MIVPLSYYEVINPDSGLDTSIQQNVPVSEVTMAYTPPVIAPPVYVDDSGLSQPVPVSSTVINLTTSPVKTLDKPALDINNQVIYPDSVPTSAIPVTEIPTALPTTLDQPKVTEKKVNYLPFLFGGGILLVAGSQKKQKKVGKIENKDLMTIALAGGLLLSFDMIKRFFEGIGIWKSAATKNIDSEETNPESAFNPNFYKNYVNYTYAITGQQALDYSTQIYDAFGVFNDCEECVFNVFYALKTKSNVSFLADKFSQKYGQSLLTFLRGGWYPQDRLSDSDLNTILQYVSKLPNN